MKNTKRKIGFTLAELLVVVVVLAVLAGVAVPKFTRVLETRKTSEAEQMLSAVRLEQEKRCTLGKSYTKNRTRVPVLASLNSDMKSANYEYTLGSQGAQAQSRDVSHANYQLKMLSYRDGRICCDDSEGGHADCKKLNKNYEACGDLLAKLSSSVDQCALPEDGKGPTPCTDDPVLERWNGNWHTVCFAVCVEGEWQYDCGEPECTLSASTCNKQIGKTFDKDACECKDREITVEPGFEVESCTLPKPKDREVSCGACEVGTQTTTWICNKLTKQWEESTLGCEMPSWACEPGSTKNTGGETCSGTVSGYRPYQGFQHYSDTDTSVIDRTEQTTIGTIGDVGGQMTISYNAGSTCNSSCRWVANSCPSTGGGGGGGNGGGDGGFGGGGPGGGDSGGSSDSDCYFGLAQENITRNQAGEITSRHCMYGINCNGKWQITSDLGDCLD